MKRGSLEDSGCSYDAEDETFPENPNQLDANESEDEHLLRTILQVLILTLKQIVKLAFDMHDMLLLFQLRNVQD